MLIPKSIWRILIIIFFIVVFGFILMQAYSLLSSLPPDKWKIGDWLINYQGGFIRRGLAGEILFRISQMFDVNLVTLIVVFQILIYLIFLVNTCRMAMESEFSALSAALIFSPAFLLFPVFDIEGGFRKEILLFALLATLCFYLSTSKTEISSGIFVYVGVIAAFITLSHEMLTAYLPYFVCAFMIYEKGVGVMTKKAIIALIPAILVIIFLFTFSNATEQAVISICNSLNMNAPVDCYHPHVPRGAISFLTQGKSFGHQMVLEYINKTSITIYLITTFLSFSPLVLIAALKLLNSFQERRIILFGLAICIFSTMAASLPLFWVSTDYGRIIYIHVTCLSLLALLISYNKTNDPLYLDAKNFSSWIYSGLFVASWRLMHFNPSFSSAFPLIKLVLNYFSKQ